MSEEIAVGGESTPDSEIFLGAKEGWKEEALAVIQDVQKFVQEIYISDQLESSSSQIYINLTTLEGRPFAIELTAQGFRIVGTSHNELSCPEHPESYFETPYSLLESISPSYIQAFGNSLAQKLSLLQQD